MHTASSVGFTRPDWVMCGGPNPAGGVRLLASKELNQAELEAQFEYRDIWDGGPFGPVGLTPIGARLTSQRITLTTEMRTFTVIDAPDYPSAFKALFEDWSPEPAARTAIGEGQRELDA